jgi:hypothetical protein
VEFAFCLPLFLICLFGAVDAGLWAIETNACVSAAEEAVRLAASSPGSPAGDPNHPDLPPAAADVTAQVRVHLQQAMFGTRILPWCATAADLPPDRLTGANCPQVAPFDTCPATPQEVQRQFGDRVVVICVHENRLPVCAVTPSPARPDCPGESPSVTVRVIGYVASLVPPAFGLGWRGGEIPVDLGARSHTQRFNP